MYATGLAVAHSSKYFSISPSPAPPPLKFSDNKTMEGREKEGSMNGYELVEPDNVKVIVAG